MQIAFEILRADWVNEPHHYMEDNTLTREGCSGDTFQILMETYAGHYFPESPDGGCATGPVLPGSYTDPLREGERRVLGTCTYGIWNEDAYQLYMDVETLRLLLDTLDETSLRAVKIAQALEQFTLIVDFEQGKEARIDSYRIAREAICPAMEAENGSTMPVFYAVGNAHLDLAWLWPMAETYRKTERTFAAQLRLIEEYPEYRFIQSQPASYEMCRIHYPELFERIKEAIRKGQWIADGAMWVEPDTNMAGGEALIRQLVHGKRYYKDVLGVESEVLWLPDTFGYTAALPQILKGCGVKYLVTQKIFWSYNDGEQFPYHYFNWEGMDGSKIVSFLPTSYTYRTDPKELNDIWKKRAQTRDLDAFLVPFGYGDGGGGPSRDYLEYARRQENLEGGVKVVMKGPKEFFEDMQEQGGPKNSYTGELYFSAHRGTYTSQAMVKKNNRKCELALREMEMWGSLAALNGWSYPLERADALWKSLLLHQFHDILPGSSIARVYVEAEAAFKEILTQTDELTAQAAGYLTVPAEAKTAGSTSDGRSGVTVYNSLSFERTALVSLPEAFGNGACTLDGRPVYTQEIGGEWKALVTLPPVGCVSVAPLGNVMAQTAPGAASEPVTAGYVESRISVMEDGSGYVMENSEIAARINQKGEVTSYILKESGREFASAPMNCFHVYKDVPRIFDAWDIDSNYVLQETEGATQITVQVLSEGLEGVLMVSGCISESSYTQYIRLAAGSRRMEFDTQIDWKELHRLLKTSFPVSVYAENAIHEMQFGYVERPTHRSRAYDKDRFEVCNHRYTALADGGHGAAILNDSKYGISVNGNSMELTLLRAGSSPEMRAEDGSKDLILRLYEAKKAATAAELTLHIGPFKAYLCDMLKHVKEEISLNHETMKLEFGAFEVKTVRIVR